MTISRLPPSPHFLNVVALLALGMFWAAYGLRNHLIIVNRNAQMALVSSRPQLLSGLHVRLGPEIGLERQVDAKGKILVLVTSDTCSHSRRQAAALLSFLHTLSMSPDDLVLLLSTDGPRIPFELAEALGNTPGRLQTLKIIDNVTFAKATGIAWTPQVIALDHHRVVRLASEVLTDVMANELRTFFAPLDTLVKGVQP